ncbi:MAG: L,D-transpeptidase [Proteobacteria bacterium]|nr:L,D-transpeptidase [Pseudomonadota bacterium]
MSGRSSRLFLALLASSSFLVPGAAQAEPPRGNLGGGFIEMLMTGQSPQQRRQGAPTYQAPAQPGYFARSGTPAVYPQPGVKRRADRVVYQAPMAEPMPSPAMVANARIDDPYEQGGLAPARAQRQNYVTAPAQSAFDPQFEKQDVPYTGPHAAGTLVIDTPRRFLYLVQGNGRALRYGIGVGRPGFEWAGAKTVSMKREWPDWRPPAEMLKRRPDLPTYMAGGPENPLGARALYLGSSLYRIHGTNEPETIGRAVSSGCIRMRNEDVVDLYGRVKVGTKVIVM